MRKTAAKEKREYEIIRALLVSNTKKEAAELLGISRQAIYGYMKDAGFMAKLKIAQEERDKQLAQAMQEAVPKALSCLLEIIEDKGGLFCDVTAKDKIDAARVILTSPAAKHVIFKDRPRTSV